MEIRAEQLADAETLIFSGEMTVSSAEGIRTALSGSLGRVGNVMLSIDSVDEIDLSCLQLFCSAHRSAVRQNKRLSIVGEYPEGFRTIIMKTGFRRQFGCALCPDKTCLWAMDIQG